MIVGWGGMRWAGLGRDEVDRWAVVGWGRWRLGRVRLGCWEVWWAMMVCGVVGGEAWHGVVRRCVAWRCIVWRGAVRCVVWSAALWNGVIRQENGMRRRNGYGARPAWWWLGVE